MRGGFDIDAKGKTSRLISDPLEGIVIWVGRPEASVLAIIWAEDGAGLIYAPSAVETRPVGWRPAIGDVVRARIMVSGGRRKAFSIQRITGELARENALSLRRALIISGRSKD